MIGNDSSPTPGRETRLVLDPVELVGTRPEWHTIRDGVGIQRMPSLGGHVSSHVSRQPGGGWTLTPHDDDLSRVITTSYSATVLTPSDMNAASNWGSGVLTYQKPTETGIGASGSLISSGVSAFTKRVPASGTWDTELSADLSALPKPTEATADVPVNRVLASKATYSENAGFALLFAIGTDFAGIDTLLRVYFGGPVQTGTTSAIAGQFCLTLRGNGEAILREFDGSAWQYRFRFPWKTAGGQGNVGYYSLSVFPYGRDTVAFRTIDTSAILSTGGATLSGYLSTLAGHAIGAQQAKPGAHFYRSQAALTGYTPGNYVTGAGQVRIDVRRDLRPLISLVHLKPSATGTLVDAPFRCLYPVPANTPIEIVASAVVPKDSTLTATVYDASTHAALTPVGTNKWKSNAGQQRYYVVWSFAADSAGDQTPVLWSYAPKVGSAAAVTRTTTPISGGALRSVSVTGPDLTPDHESATLSLEDPLNAYALLDIRARVHARVNVYNESGALLSVLMEGEIQRCESTQKGTPGMTFPNPTWKKREPQLTGMWARLNDQINMCPRKYLNAPDGSGYWKVTDVIADLFLYAANVPAVMLAIPDIDVRLGPVIDSAEDTYIIQPGTNIGETIQALARDYLGMVLCWDPNAGTYGMWRLLQNPDPASGNFLAAFVGGPSAGHLAMHPNSYPAGTAPIEWQTFTQWPAAPECNFIAVLGAGGAISPDGGLTGYSAALYNPISFDFVGATSNPLHQDYLGRWVGAVVSNPTIGSPEAAALVCRRIYDLACHGKSWASFRAPLLFVTDPLDPYQVRPRPLRIHDLIYVLGVPCVVRSCNPEYQHDTIQRATYEVLALA